MTTEMQANRSYKLARAAGALSDCLLFLADQGTSRLSAVQLAFFWLAAAADIRGQPMTLAEIMETYGDKLNASVENTYRTLLEPTKSQPNGIGWLRRDPDPDDERKNFLVLTQKGQNVVDEALSHLRRIELR